MKMKKYKNDYKWQLVIILWFAYFLNQGDRQIFNVVIPLIKADLQISDVQIGLVATIFTVITMRIRLSYSQKTVNFAPKIKQNEDC